MPQTKTDSNADFHPLKVYGDLWRGRMPRNADEFAALKAIGIKRILCLESRVNPEFAEKSNVFNIPMSAIRCPQFSTVCTAVAFATQSIGMGLPVYVCCRQGDDRTGIVCAVYRCMVCGWNGRAAFQEMINNGFHYGRYFYWITSIREMLGIYQ